MTEDFQQEPPRLSNTFEADPLLRETLERLVPPELRRELAPAWHELGEAAAGRLLALAREAERDPPRHVPFDAWGRRIDDVRVSPAWAELRREATCRGLVAIPYEAALGPWARLHQFALLDLFGPSSAIFTCYVAMTDGAARTLLEHAGPELQARAVPRLTSRDPAVAWTSGQWMTERSGGSDVGGTRTRARRGEDGRWRLWGTKWFTSAVTSEMALTLARPEGAPGGSAGLSLFYLEQRLPDGSRNGITIHRLKDKLGTRALPTAELSLEGCLAEPVGEPGAGVKSIAPLLNLTRLHNAINACGLLARMLQLLRDYSLRRAAFGARLAGHPLHRVSLAELQLEYEAALALTLDCARLLGRQEAREASAEERCALRLLTPLAKLATARQAVAGCSEALEGFGGAGYVEDTGLPVFLRDAQVLPIWEGTTNVLSLDVLRASLREGALDGWLAEARRRLRALAAGPLGPEAQAVERHLALLEGGFRELAGAGREVLESAARSVALSLSAAAACVPMLEQGAWGLGAGRGERSALAARRWLVSRLRPVPDPRLAAAELRAAGALAVLPEPGEEPL